MDQLSYDKARRRARHLRSFYSHLIVYIVMNAFLIVLNLITDPDHLWFYWVTIFWGLGLVFHAVNTFTLRSKFLGEEWEEKKARRYMDKDQQKHSPGH